jgi:hypothetical protein
MKPRPGSQSPDGVFLYFREVLIVPKVVLSFTGSKLQVRRAELYDAIGTWLHEIVDSPVSIGVNEF